MIDLAGSAARYAERIRRLLPLARLPRDMQDDLLAHAAYLVELRPGDVLHVQDQEDEFVSYLLAGRVQRVVDEQRLDVLDAGREVRDRPLDDTARKRDTAVALSPVTVLRMLRRELEEACRRVAGEPGDGGLEVTDIDADTSMDWRSRLLRSGLFMRLSAPAIQSVFECMEEVDVSAGHEVVRQGDPGDWFYVIQSGLCSVLRRRSTDGQEVLLADLGPGDIFGEEALISDAPRNATVRVVSDAKLMRMTKSDFLERLVEPLVRGVSYRQARWLVEQGGAWVDVRDRTTADGHGIDGALRIPVHLMRLQSKRLDRNTTYVVCGEDLGTRVLATFLLAARGLEATFLEQPLSQVNLETSPMSEAKKENGAEPAASAADERIDRDEFAETTTGEQLADLIDELYRQREALGEAAPVAAAPAPAEDGVPTLVAPTTPARSGEPVVPANEGSESLVGLSAEEIVDDLLRNVNSGLGRYITQSLERQRSELEAHLQHRLALLERMARDRVEAYEREIKARYGQALEDKERELAEAYDRLTRLANRISRQKADMQQARKTLESMLRTASRVHQEVSRVGNALVDQIDHLDDFRDQDGTKTH